MTSIRKFDPERDSGWLHAMWQETLSPLWSVSAAELMRRIRTAGISFVAERGGMPAGFCIASCNPSNETAAILAVIVDPAHRRVGVGTALLDEIQKALGQQGTSSLALGYGGAKEYFWPGVPKSQRGAWEFFASRGWEPQERNFDLVVDLVPYRTPAWVVTRLQKSHAILQFADAEAAASIVRFERANFPEWTDLFEETFARHEYRNVLYAKASDAVVGAVLLNADEPVLWSQALGLRCGSFGILGVARSQEGKGIGLALAARALETVQQRGCSTCYIGWTGLVNWYAKLGATIWSEYRMGRKQLSLAAPPEDITRVPVKQSDPVLVERRPCLVLRTVALLAATVLSRALLAQQPCPLHNSRISLLSGSFSSQPGVSFDLRHFRATLVPMGRTAPLCYDKMTVVSHAEIFVSNESLSNIFSEKLKASKSTIKDFTVENGPSSATLSGKITHLVLISFAIEGPVTTNGTVLRLYAKRIKADGIPIKELLHLVGAELNSVLHLKGISGVAIEGDTLSFSPEQIAHLSGHIASVTTSTLGLTLRYEPEAITKARVRTK